jgi:hypothetical protein
MRLSRTRLLLKLSESASDHRSRVGETSGRQREPFEQIVEPSPGESPLTATVQHAIPDPTHVVIEGVVVISELIRAEKESRFSRLSSSAAQNGMSLDDSAVDAVPFPRFRASAFAALRSRSDSARRFCPSPELAGRQPSLDESAVRGTIIYEMNGYFERTLAAGEDHHRSADRYGTN